MLEPNLVFCTLLGPEGPGRREYFLMLVSIGPLDHWPSGLRSSDLVVGWVNPFGGRYRPYFENYTVDASILDSTERSDHINDDI